MALRELPTVEVDKRQAPWSGNGRYGAAHARPRDAYKDVPILKPPTWSHEIAAYFYLGGISSGAYVLAGAAEAMGGQRYKPLARVAHYVSVATMLPCPALLIADLGKRSRFHHMLRIVKPSSPMNLGAWALTVHGAMATLTAVRVLAGEGKLPLLGPVISLLPERALAVAGLPSALTLGGYTGVLLGTSSVPAWFKSPLLGGLFMASAMSTGAAAAKLAAALGGLEQRRSDPALKLIGVASGLTEGALLGGYLATSGPAAAAYGKGRPRLLMAGAAAALCAGTALEIVRSRVNGAGRVMGIAAAAATLAGGALLRWAVVTAGHPSSQDRDVTLEVMKPAPEAPGWTPSGDGVEK